MLELGPLHGVKSYDTRVKRGASIRRTCSVFRTVWFLRLLQWKLQSTSMETSAYFKQSNSSSMEVSPWRQVYSHWSKYASTNFRENFRRRTYPPTDFHGNFHGIISNGSRWTLTEVLWKHLSSWYSWKKVKACRGIWKLMESSTEYSWKVQLLEAVQASTTTDSRNSYVFSMEVNLLPPTSMVVSMEANFLPWK